jgi:hypothetical protein
VLAFAYVAAALLELAGIATVLLDVRSGARRAAALADQLQHRSYVSRNTSADRVALIVNRAATQADRELAAAITEILSGNLRRRLLGPGLLVAGVIVGAAANIAAL